MTKRERTLLLPSKRAGTPPRLHPGWPKPVCCLRCDERFRSPGPQVRLCDRCRLAVAELGPWWIGGNAAWRPGRSGGQP